MQRGTAAETALGACTTSGTILTAFAGRTVSCDVSAEYLAQRRSAYWRAVTGSP